MQTHSLDGTWQLTYGIADGNRPANPVELAAVAWPTVPATVPGNVEIDLMNAGILGDVTRGNRIYDALKYETYDWWFQRRFNAPALEGHQRAELVFEGLDCFGTIWLNDHELGSTANMLIAHRFDVTSLLHPGEDNALIVRIRSAVREGRQLTYDPLTVALQNRYESVGVRKAPHGYGWDIMPRAVSAGLWRSVSLAISEPERIRDIYWSTLLVDPARQTAGLRLHWGITTPRVELDELRLQVVIKQSDNTLYDKTDRVYGTTGQWRPGLENVRLWWPRGYGEPALCEAVVRLKDASDRVLDENVSRIGVRTVELRHTPVTAAEKPGEFVFVVNGEKIFVHGSNWVPLDAYHSCDPGHLAATFDMLVDLNCNMIRSWGGSVYEDHAFFDLCDRHGLLVWQDFAMACAIYPQTDAFAAAIREEAEFIVRKLRNHPSLALWAGNNENDEAFDWHKIDVDPNTDRLSRDVLPGVVRRLDPARPYLPSSPYRSPEFIQSGAHPEHQPEQHLWGPRDDFKGPYYAQSAAHFVSEIGYHGCPDRRALERFLDPEFLWPWQNNEQWLTKAVRPRPEITQHDHRIALMARQAGLLFGGQTPDDLDHFILASQISQAEALKFFIEWARRGKWRRTGMLWWNLRDGWPVISDAVVDYYYYKKLAYEYIKRVQSDVCVMCGEPEQNQQAIHAVNDTLQEVAGELLISDVDSRAVLLKKPFAIAANGIATVDRLAAPSRPSMWLISWTTRDGRSGRNHYLAGPRPFDLAAYRRWLAALDIPEDVGPLTVRET